MSFSYFAVTGPDGKPMSVHAHKDYAPVGGMPISEEEAVAISQARRSSQPAQDIVKPDMTQLEIMKAMADELVRLRADLEAVKQTELVYEVKKA